MNGIQSFVFKNNNLNEVFTEKNKTFLYSLVCSFFSNIKISKNLSLYGNSFSEEIFIKILNLPYSNFYSINDNNSEIFINSKIETFKNQNKKFYFSDCNFFITKNIKFTKSNDLLFLYEYTINESLKKIYYNYFIRLLKYTEDIPEILYEINSSYFNQPIKNYNMSFVLFNNKIKKIVNYFDILHKYINQNLNVIENLNKIEPYYDTKFKTNINTFLEEFLFSYFVTKNKLNIEIFNTSQLHSSVHVGPCKFLHCEENQKIEKFTKKHYKQHYELINDYINIWKT